MKACKDSGGWSNSADHAAAGYMIPVKTLCVATGQAGAEIGADMAPTLNCNHEAPYVAHSLRGDGFQGTDEACGGYVQPVSAFCIKGAAIGRTPEAGPQYGEVLEDICYTQNCVEQHAVAYTLRGEGFDAGEDGTGRGTPLAPVAFQYNMSGANAGGTVDFCGTLKASNEHAVACTTAVRRLTPRECERLQGFPDDWTLIPWRKNPASDCPDGPRYKALGNSWAVPVARWIGKRIEQQMKGNK